MAELTYTSYIQTDALLSLQQTQSPETMDRAVVLSEHFFIVAHQSCELWLKQVIADLNLAKELLSAPFDQPAALETGTELLVRARELMRVLHEQVVALERLPLRHFAEFRPYLGTASGAQSMQFRVLGRLVGDGERDGELYGAFTRCAAAYGYDVAAICRLGVDGGALYRVAEALLDVGIGYWRWKVTHLGLVSKMIGSQGGTGGTSGEDFLARRVTVPFPELRRLRGALHDQDLARTSA